MARHVHSHTLSPQPGRPALSHRHAGPGASFCRPRLCLRRARLPRQGRFRWRVPPIFRRAWRRPRQSRLDRQSKLVQRPHRHVGPQLRRHGPGAGGQPRARRAEMPGAVDRVDFHVPRMDAPERRLRLGAGARLGDRHDDHADRARRPALREERASWFARPGGDLRADRLRRPGAAGMGRARPLRRLLASLRPAPDVPGRQGSGAPRRRLVRPYEPGPAARLQGPARSRRVAGGAPRPAPVDGAVVAPEHRRRTRGTDQLRRLAVRRGRVVPDVRARDPGFWTST